MAIRDEVGPNAPEILSGRFKGFFHFVVRHRQASTSIYQFA
jgi:hypothetical protein